jgi:hypothetical protein
MELLDPLLKELDDQWTKGLVPDISALLHRAGYPQVTSCIELCAVDLEWRWRWTSGDATRQVPPSTVALPARPVAHDYRSLILEHWHIRECRLQMMEAEWIARGVWGDQPNVESFLDVWGVDGVTPELLMKSLEKVAPLFVNVLHEGLCVFTAAVSSEFIMGRRQDDEPLSPHWMPTRQRLVVAELTDTKCSRNQAQLRRTRMNEVFVANLSQKVEMRLGSYILRPQDGCHLPLPLHIAVGDVRLVLSGSFTG